MEGQTQNKDQVAILMVPFPMQGHLNQLLHLSHRLTTYRIPVHYAGSAIHNRQAKLRLQGWDPETCRNIIFHDLPLAPFSSPPPNPNSPFSFPAHLQPLMDAYIHLQKPMSTLLHNLASKFNRLIVINDILMSSVIQDVKHIPNAYAYNLIPISAVSMFTDTWEGLTEKPFKLDSNIQTRLPSGDSTLTQEVKDFAAKQGEFQDFQSGTLFNTCRVMEGRYLELMEKLPMNADRKCFAVGPFHPMESKIIGDNKQRHECLEWLDQQEMDSVIYVSFGSNSSLTNEQIIELAKGLEKSGQKFIWVLKTADRGDVFVEDEVGKAEVPEGFEERVKNRGMVVREWAPQLEILGHRSTGGFISHCGWNSCLESVSMGVPMAAWPLHSDQPKNAFFVTQVLKIGLEVRDWARNAELVTSDTVEDAVRRLMGSKEGEVIRKRAAELGQKVRESVSEGGASRLEMDAFVAHITS